MKFDLLRAVPGRLTIAETSHSPDARPGRRSFRHNGDSSPLARWLAVSLLPLAALALSTGAQANTLTVSTTVQATCTTSGGSVSFGTYTASQTMDVQAAFDITCTNGANVSIHLNEGMHLESGDRRMKNGGENYIIYQLYQDSGRQTVWGGNGYFNPKPVTGFIQGTNGTQQVYARIPSQAAKPAGGYSDTVGITFTF